MSSWLTTIMSRRSTPAPRSIGTTMRPPLSASGAVGRPRVVEQRVARGALHDHPSPCPTSSAVIQASPAAGWGGASENAGAISKARGTRRHAARAEQPECARDRRGRGPDRRHVLLPQRARQRRAPFEKSEQPLDQPRSDFQNQRNRKDRRHEREGRHDDRHRNGDGIGERPSSETCRRGAARRREPTVIAHACDPLQDPRPFLGDVEDERHCAERQPQARRERRPHGSAATMTTSASANVRDGEVMRPHHGAAATTATMGACALHAGGNPASSV